MPFKFEKLEVWKLALEYVNLIYGIAEKLPSLEEYNLKSQIIRAGTGIALNIAGSAPEGKMSVFFVYAIQSLSTKRIYIGQTRDVDQRLSYHNSGYVKSTYRDKPLKLLALQKVPSRNEARWIERELKKSKDKRRKWIEQNRIGK